MAKIEDPDLYYLAGVATVKPRFLTAIPPGHSDSADSGVAQPGASAPTLCKYLTGERDKRIPQSVYDRTICEKPV